LAEGLEADLLLDRRRLTRRLFVWRVVAVLFAIAAVASVGRGKLQTVTGQHVERLSVTGIITQNRKLIEAVDALGKDASVAAVIVSVDSPGGSVAGGESLHNALARLAAVKPVVTVMGGTAASAGYMISLPAARIFASDATLTGSIGVILETGNAAGLLDKLGLSAEAIISGPLKDQPSFTHGLSPDGRTYLQALVMDMYGQFVTMVATARHLDESRVRELADGRAYTGRQARELGLIDEIGGEPEARGWLERERNIAASLPVQDLKLGSLYERTIGATLDGLWPAALTQLVPQPGAWALWRP
jgi:protease IV